LPTSAAASVASSCSGRLAPSSGAVISGFAITQATASVASGTPASSASLCSCATVPKLRSFQ